jgi:hypothetical protein
MMPIQYVLKCYEGERKSEDERHPQPEAPNIIGKITTPRVFANFQPPSTRQQQLDGWINDRCYLQTNEEPRRSSLFEDY